MSCTQKKDYLIKWGYRTNSRFGKRLGSENSDRTKWNDKDYEALKEALSEFLPLIRLVAIPPADFFDKVRPYRAIIPNHILPKSLSPPHVETLFWNQKLLSQGSQSLRILSPIG